MNHIYETEFMDTIETFWNNWNRTHEKNMKCIHKYLFNMLD